MAGGRGVYEDRTYFYEVTIAGQTLKWHADQLISLTGYSTY